MAIEKYTTECIVVESFDNGEHDRVYKLFTRDFGLITAHAKSIRKLESKLRAHIKPRSVSLATLVRGREVWRLVGAEEKYFEGGYIHEITSLIKRFIKGEGAHHTLYDRLRNFSNTNDIYDKSLTRLMLYFIVLTELGYADVKSVGAKDMNEYNSWSLEDLYTRMTLSQNDVRGHIHVILKETHL